MNQYFASLSDHVSCFILNPLRTPWVSLGLPIQGGEEGLLPPSQEPQFPLSAFQASSFCPSGLASKNHGYATERDPPPLYDQFTVARKLHYVIYAGVHLSASGTMALLLSLPGDSRRRIFFGIL